MPVPTSWRPGSELDCLPDESAGRSGLGTPGHFLTLTVSLEPVARSAQGPAVSGITPRRGRWHSGALTDTSECLISESSSARHPASGGRSGRLAGWPLGRLARAGRRVGPDDATQCQVMTRPRSGGWPVGPLRVGCVCRGAMQSIHPGAHLAIIARWPQRPRLRESAGGTSALLSGRGMGWTGGGCVAHLRARKR
jgi:hypothetical protein